MTQFTSVPLNQYPNLIELIGRQSELQTSEDWWDQVIGSDELSDNVDLDPLSAAPESGSQDQIAIGPSNGVSVSNSGALWQGEADVLGDNLLQDETESLSDSRLKADIAQVGITVHGLPLYKFRYIGGAEVYEGVMAQDVLKVMPSAVLTGADGYYRVKYKELGLQMRRVA